MRYCLALLCSLFLLSSSLLAADLPASWNAGMDLPAAPASVQQLESMDFESLAAEDAFNEALGQPPRFAVPHDVSVSPLTSGQWLELDHGISVWRYRVQAGNAVSLNFGFRDVRMPEGAALYFYTPEAAKTGKPDRYNLIGPFGTDINEKHGQFWTPLLASSDVVIELNVPTVLRDQASLELFRIGQGYRGFGLAADGYRQNASMTAGEGKSACDAKGAKSGSCNTDVACLGPDDPWNDPRRAVGGYSFGGSLFCTGSLVNNTAEDQRMLFLTATHCGVDAGNAASVVVYWNYEWPTCRTPGDAEGTSVNTPDPNSSQSGASFLAATIAPIFDPPTNEPTCFNCSDMTLLELDDPANPDFNLFWTGWDRSSTAAQCGPAVNDSSTENLCASIHHPSGDEKRITFVDTDFAEAGIGNANGVHWLAFWDPTPPILPNIAAPQPATLPPSVTEPGSSGSPLYNADKRLVGVLSGGASFCGATGNSLSDQYGKLAHAWEGLGTAQTRMRDYLDPQGTAPEFINGLGATADPNPPTGPEPVCANPSIDIVEQGTTNDTLTTEGGPIQSVTVQLNIAHTWVGDTRVVLTHENSGRSVTLYDRPGIPATTFGCPANNVEATFSDAGSGLAEDACSIEPPAISGTFRPVDALSTFNGLAAASDWRLNVFDEAIGDTGTLNRWCLTIETADAVEELLFADGFEASQ